MKQNTTTELGEELASKFTGYDAPEIVEDTPNEIRITNIPHSATHMLPGGMGTLDALSEHWNDWEIEYVDNGDTVMYGSKSDKDVVITRTA